MKNIFAVIFVISLFFSTNCGNYSDDCMPWVDTEQPKFLGTINLNDSNECWINENWPKDVRFTNSSLESNIFRMQKISRGAETYNYRMLEYYDGCGMQYGFDYFYLEYEFVKYITYDAPLTFSFRRSKNTWSDIDSADLIHAKERLFVSVNSFDFEIPIEYKPPNIIYHYYDSISIGGHLYQNIYHVYTDSIISSQTANKVIAVYYGFDDGLVRFDFKNGEIWYISK